MKVLVVYKRMLERTRRRIVDVLRELRLSYDLVKMVSGPQASGFDLVAVVGGDGDVLRVIQGLGPSNVPVLGVNEAEGGTFLTAVGLSEFREALDRFVRNDYRIEEGTRLGVKADGQELPPALNEAAVFPSRTATFLEYLLTVDGESVWRDYSDGVIIATPTGSTAYAMSAGGPIVLPQAKVFVVVPVNSADVTRRPLVVQDSSIIQVSEITSRYECEVVVDGTSKTRLKETLEVSKYPAPARFVKLPTTSPTIDRMAKKVKLAEELLKMPPSAKLVLKTLEYEGPLGQRELVKKTLLPERTARLALTILLQKGLVKRKALLRDTRQKIYSVT